MNKKILIGSLFSLMIILSLIISVIFVSAVPQVKTVPKSRLNATGDGTSIAGPWINITTYGNNSQINITLLSEWAAGDNATNVSIRLLPGTDNYRMGFNTNFNFSSIISGVGGAFPWNNISFITSGVGENMTLMWSTGCSGKENGNWWCNGSWTNGTKKWFVFNITALWKSTDYNVTFNVTIWASNNTASELDLNLGIDTNATMSITGINVTDDGTNVLYDEYATDSDNSINPFKNLNGSGYLKNTKTYNITVVAIVTNTAGTSPHYVTLFYNTSSKKPTSVSTGDNSIIMTYMGNNTYIANIPSTSWGNHAGYAVGPVSNSSGASYINVSFSIFVNDTLNPGFNGGVNNSKQYWNFTFDGNYPGEPVIGMPKTTIIFAGTGIKIKCDQHGDLPNNGTRGGVKATTITITKPDGDTISKEVPDASREVEFISSDIMTPGDYQVKCTSEDYVGWTTDDTTTDEFKVIYYSTGGAGGGGAGEGGVTETKVFDADFTKLNEKEFNRNEGTSVSFSLDGTIEHKITWTKVESNSVTLTIESTPQDIKLNVGESKELDVTGDGINDINVKLVKIDDTNADVVVIKLVGAQETPSGGETTPTEEEITPSTTTTTTSSTTWIIIAIVVILIIIIGYFFMRKK